LRKYKKGYVYMAWHWKDKTKGITSEYLDWLKTATPSTPEFENGNFFEAGEDGGDEALKARFQWEIFRQLMGWEGDPSSINTWDNLLEKNLREGEEICFNIFLNSGGLCFDELHHKLNIDSGFLIQIINRMKARNYLIQELSLEKQEWIYKLSTSTHLDREAGGSFNFNVNIETNTLSYRLDSEYALQLEIKDIEDEGIHQL